MASVTLEHLDKRFPNGRHAVRDLSLEIHDGEFIVLVGPSGCGKTTTLRMIAGLEEPTSGEVYIGGRLMNRVPPSMRDIAMVFQNQALYPHMSVYQNMAFGLRMRRAPRAGVENQVRAAARMLSIESLLDRRPKSSPAASGSVSRWVARSSASRRSSFLMSRFRTWMPGFVETCARKSRGCIVVSRRPSSTSRIHSLEARR
jgi:multiple sugar transport system ATP-binding protein